MNRRHFLTTSALAAAAPQILARPTSELSLKKGWSGGTTQVRELFGSNWYYNWGINGKGEDFVPMFKGKKQIQGGGLRQLRAKEHLPVILGYNEPERKKQGNLTLKEALDFWPKLQEVAQAKGSRLGSPAPSSDKGGMEWLEAFMDQAKRQKLQVDFIAVHYYRSKDPDVLKSFIKDLAKTYRRPIWLTEFNGWAGPQDEHEDFLKGALRFLERERSVERYAYFEPGKGKPHSLFKKDGSLSLMGEMYQEAGL